MKPAELDLTGKRWPPDQWQPAWIRDVYFGAPDPDLHARVLPLPPEAVFADPGWHHWGASVLQADDGTWHMFYARWPAALDAAHQTNSFQDWLWKSEIAHAVAPAMTGPWRHVETVLQGRGAGHWDLRNAHNPRLRRFDGRFYLYYIADTIDPGDDADRSNKGPNWMPLRNSQRTGVAVADALAGPWTRGDVPLLAPGGPIANVAVNPTIVRRPQGDYLMLAKGDAPGTRAFRYGIALGPAPGGPFAWQEQPIDTGFSSEDPDVFFDAARGRYYALITQTRFNNGRRYVPENGGIGVIRSVDGLDWRDAGHPLVLGPVLRCADGTERAFRRVERPSAILDADGRLVGLTCAALPPDGANAVTIVVPLAPER
ncbi:MAG: glycoside hydrolase family protein [Planctomycetota bacterium]